MSSRQVARRGYDAKRRATKPWRHLYKTPRWQAIRIAQFKAQRFCQECERLDPPRLYTPATVCDHVDRHDGDRFKFFAGPFQSLCKPCHDARKQREEVRGYRLDVGADGWPIDGRHPTNRDERGNIYARDPPK